MNYRSQGHQSIFTQAVERISRKNSALMAALYLLTADMKLWSVAKCKVEKDHLHLDQLHLQNCSPDAYALLCVTKDIYLGTKHMTINDLADTDLIPSTIFSLICNAMAIRRFGIRAAADDGG